MPPSQLIESLLTVDLHGLKLAFHSPDLSLRERFERVYGHLPHVKTAENDIFVEWRLHNSDEAPPPPELPVISEGALVSYYGSEERVAVRLPRYGLIVVDLTQRRLSGMVTRHCLEAYGVFEDVLMISLAPLYRRQGWFPVHAFAARSPYGRVALIAGAMGSGKTTTGLALLSAGWKLLSNDSPLLTIEGDQVKVLAYPGQLSAFDDSLVRFRHLRRFTAGAAGRGRVMEAVVPGGSPKRVFRPEEAFENPWATSGPAGGVFFPQIAPGLTQSELVKVTSSRALLQLMPQAIEGWDKSAIGQNLAIIGKLVEQAPCYMLRLSPDVEQLPGVIAAGMV